MHDELDMGQKKSGAGKYIAIGCLSMVFVVLIALVIGGIVVANNWKTWASNVTTTVASEAIRDTDLPPEDKKALIDRVELIGDEFKNETISWDELQGVFETLAESPILTVAVMDAMHTEYFEVSSLTDEEKARAERISDRLARGLYDERIELEELEPVLSPISKGGMSSITINKTEDGTTTGINLNLKSPDDVTADELRAFMDQADSMLEQKAIADEPFDIDFVEEFDKAVEEALGRRIVPEGE